MRSYALRPADLPAGSPSDLHLRERLQSQLQLALRELTMASLNPLSKASVTPRWLAALAVATAAGVVGCSGANEPVTACNLDSLSGTWRISYRETNGNCGAIPDETVNTSAAGSGSATTACRSQSYSVSSNKCRTDQSFTCATTDGRGTQAWTVVSQQGSASSVSGTATVQLTHPTVGTCRSTYAMTWIRL